MRQPIATGAAVEEFNGDEVIVSRSDRRERDAALVFGPAPVALNEDHSAPEPADDEDEPLAADAPPTLTPPTVSSRPAHPSVRRTVWCCVARRL